MGENSYCSVCKRCNGCQLSNLGYERQLRYKQNELRLRFNRLAPMEKIIPSESTVSYRNKAQFVFKRLRHGDIVTGIYQSSDSGMVVTESCSLHTPSQNSVAQSVARLMKSFKIAPFDRRSQSGTVKNIIVRESFSTGEIMLVIVCDSSSAFPCAKAFCDALLKEHGKLSSVILTKSRGSKLTAGVSPRVISGKDHITETLCSLDFVISYNSFFQINSKQAEVLYSTAIDMARLKKSDTVLDAYCGTGTIGLICAGHSKEVLSVEQNENAIHDARHNARLNNIKNIRFICADSERYIRDLRNERTAVTVAFLDPPRAGCSMSFLKNLCSISPQRIVYISCNIDTQIRDARFIIKQGYRLVKTRGVDMFPYTKHIENIALFELEDKNEQSDKAFQNDN